MFSLKESFPIKDTKIVVTGGAGHIGSRVIDFLLSEGAGEIVAFDNLSRTHNWDNLSESMSSGRVKVVEGSVENPEALDHAINKADYVVHMATIRLTRAKIDPGLAKRVMRTGTLNVLAACQEQNVRKVIYYSSASVYGQQEEYPIKEHFDLKGEWIYANEKKFCEHLFQTLISEARIKGNILRPFNVVGPRMSTNKDDPDLEVVPIWINQIKNNEAPIIHGLPSRTYDFTYTDDVARATILALKSSRENEIYNIGTGIETSLQSLALMLLRMMGSQLMPKIEDPGDRIIVSRRVADISKARNELGYKPTLDVASSLSVLLKSLNIQPYLSQ